jgi:hypothetical protein
MGSVWVPATLLTLEVAACLADSMARTSLKVSSELSTSTIYQSHSHNYSAVLRFQARWDITHVPAGSARNASRRGHIRLAGEYEG